MTLLCPFFPSSASFISLSVVLYMQSKSFRVLTNQLQRTNYVQKPTENFSSSDSFFLLSCFSFSLFASHSLSFWQRGHLVPLVWYCSCPLQTISWTLQKYTRSLTETYTPGWQFPKLCDAHLLLQAVFGFFFAEKHRKSDCRSTL